MLKPCFEKSLLLETPDILAQECTSCTFLGYKFAGANLLLLGTTDIPVRFEKSFTVSLLKIYGIDTRREHKLTAGVSLIR